MWVSILATGGNSSRLTDLLALRPNGACDPGDGYVYDLPENLCNGTFLPGVGNGAWWQPMTAAFTHVELWHIAGNLLAIFILGPALEGIIGRTRFLAVYVAGALGGSVAVLWLSNPLSSTVGASGAIFGLLGALLVTATKARVDNQWIVQNIMLGVLITVIGWRFISWQGHLGGFLAGAAAAAIIAFAPKTHRVPRPVDRAGAAHGRAGGARRRPRHDPRLTRTAGALPGAPAYDDPRPQPGYPQVCTQLWITTPV